MSFDDFLLKIVRAKMSRKKGINQMGYKSFDDGVIMELDFRP